MAEKKNILLIGTGAIGSYYGGRLASENVSITTLCRSDYDIVKKSGIKIKSINGDFCFKPDNVINSISDYKEEPDFIIIATKVLPEIDHISLIKDVVSAKTAIVLLQNGISIEEPYLSVFPENEIIRGLAFICVTRINYGEVFHQDYGRLVLGKYPLGKSEKVLFLENIFKEAGVECFASENVKLACWRKLVWNAPFNPLSVLANRASTKEIMQNEMTAELARKIMQEIVILSEKDGYTLSEDVIEKNLSDTLKMRPYKTSMLLDFENKRNMEVEAILGNAYRLSLKYKIAIPYLETIYSILSLVNLKQNNSL